MEAGAEELELALVPAGPKAEDQPPAAQDVERRDLLRHDHRAALRQHQDGDAEAHAVGQRRQVGQRGQSL